MAKEEHLLAKIQDRTVKVAIVGLGYVSLPLAVEFARARVRTVGIDLDQERVERINSGKSYIQTLDGGDVANLVTKGSLSATSDYALFREMDAAFVCVPTPYTKMKTPDLSYVESACRELSGHLRQGQLIVLQSTTYPGTTEEVVLPLLESSGLKAGEDFFLAFSPERIDPGNRIYGVRNTPKVVGGINEQSTRLACALFELLVEREQIHRAACRTRTDPPCLGAEGCRDDQAVREYLPEREHRLGQRIGQAL